MAVRDRIEQLTSISSHHCFQDSLGSQPRHRPIVKMAERKGFAPLICLLLSTLQSFQDCSSSIRSHSINWTVFSFNSDHRNSEYYWLAV